MCRLEMSGACGSLVGLATAAGNAQAWGADGHRLIADTAGSQLSGQARAEVGRLLALEPGAKLASIFTPAACARLDTGSGKPDASVSPSRQIGRESAD